MLGEYITGHRCAGERLTIEAMKKALEILVTKMEYTIPEQNLELSTREMPSVPKSRFVMENVERV